jgi:hypothetical protein
MELKLPGPEKSFPLSSLLPHSFFRLRVKNYKNLCSLSTENPFKNG